jgi:hypothetical protein
MDRKLLLGSFEKHTMPKWTCPTCGQGTLKLKADTFQYEESRATREARDELDCLDEDQISYVYTCLLICSSDDCREIVANSGVGSVDWRAGEDEDGMPAQVYFDSFSPQYFSPHLNLIAVSEKCPAAVSERLNNSFNLFFADQNASANCVRSALEAVLTDLNIPAKNSSGGYVALDCRINKLPQEYEAIKKMALAVKWKGNTGSHGNGALKREDVMDAYALFEYIVEEVYEQKEKKEKLDELAKSINAAKGAAGYDD